MTTTRSTLAALGLGVLGTLACSGESKSDADDSARNRGGTGGQPSMQKPAARCPEPKEPIDPTSFIDDMEDENGEVLAIGDRNGGWWTAGDDTVGASMIPVQTNLTGELALPEAIPAGRCGSNYAMRVTGQGFLDWGAILGFDFRFGENSDGEAATLPYDASTRAGIEFFARIGDTSTAEVRIQLSDTNSEPAGGVCVEMGGQGKDCWDSFGTGLLRLDTTWQHYRIPFAGLGQRDFGVQADALVTSAIYNVTFNFPSAAIFDFWVDDVSFY